MDKYKSNPHKFQRNKAIVYMLKHNQMTETSEIFCGKTQATYYPETALVYVSTSSY